MHSKIFFFLGSESSSLVEAKFKYDTKVGCQMRVWIRTMSLTLMPLVKDGTLRPERTIAQLVRDIDETAIILVFNVEKLKK